MRTLFRKTGTLLLAASLFGASIAPVQAGMVGTSQALAAEQGTLDRARLASLLEREDLQRQLTAMGVDVQQAKDRVASLTDAEIAELNQRIGAQPAGGASVLGVFVLLLLVLVITDLLGVTDVYPFVNPAK
jgi:hypothetical protein